MSENGGLVLALDFGGTKLAAALYEPEHDRLFPVKNQLVPAGSSAEDQFSDMIRLAFSFPGIEQIKRIGVCFGGQVAGGRIIRSMHIPGWEDFPLRQRLREAFAVDLVSIGNDANAVALAEALYGSGRGVHSFLYVTISTGIGSGIILDGRIYEGSHGLAGEIGHIHLLDSGPPCACGKMGCLESLASGTAIARSAEEILRDHPGTPSNMRRLENLSAQQVAEQAKAGDEMAARVIIEAGKWLGQGLAIAVNLLDVELVVLGGGVTRSGDIWWKAVRQSYWRHVLPELSQVQLVASGLGEYEGVWGAVALINA